jgi:hypothetical protein
MVWCSWLVTDHEISRTPCHGFHRDPLSSYSVAGILLGPTTVNGVMPSGGPANCPRSTCDLGW